MAKGPSYRVAFRRRREGKTDYQQRKGLVLSGLPRMVIRGSLRNISVQLIKAEVGGDKVIVSAHSKELGKNYGWQGGGCNLSAAYLTGLLCGYRARARGVEEAVLDLGLQTPTKGSRISAALKGVLDAEITVSHDENKLPDEKRVLGQHIAEYAKQLSSTPDLYQKQFSNLLSRRLRPEEITEHFSQVKQKIFSAFQSGKVPEKREEEEKQLKEKTENKKKPQSAVDAQKIAKLEDEKLEGQKKVEETK